VERQWNTEHITGTSVSRMLSCLSIHSTHDSYAMSETRHRRQYRRARGPRVLPRLLACQVARSSKNARISQKRGEQPIHVHLVVSSSDAHVSHGHYSYPTRHTGERSTEKDFCRYTFIHRGCFHLVFTSLTLSLPVQVTLGVCAHG
jgi:hypothetical protein